MRGLLCMEVLLQWSEKCPWKELIDTRVRHSYDSNGQEGMDRTRNVVCMWCSFHHICSYSGSEDPLPEEHHRVTLNNFFQVA